MIEGDGTCEGQSIEAFFLQIDRLVWLGSNMKIEFRRLIPWLMVKVVINERVMQSNACSVTLVAAVVALTKKLE